jgi:hypothetical protein
MAMPELRPMGIGDILDATFRLYRDRFVRFATIALIVYVPLALVIGLLQTQFAAAVPQTGQPLRPEDVFPVLLKAMGAGMVVTFLSWVFGALCSGALVHNISSAYLGEELGSRESYARAAPRLLRLLAAQFVAGLVIFVGFALCIVPGVIFGLWFLLLAPVVMLENEPVMKSLERSRELMRGNLGKGFLLMLVVTIIWFVIYWVVQFVVTRIPWHPYFAHFSLIVLQALVLPIQLAPPILLYYDLRIRKEAFDLEQLAASLGRPAAL